MDGMFLGKQELERIQSIERAGDGPLRSLLRVSSNNPTQAVIGRPINPKFSHLKIESRTVGSTVGVAVGLDPSYDYSSTEIAVLGRGLVGLGIGAPILDSGWTGKEGWATIGSLSGGRYYVQIKGATTNYENALISVDANGLCTFSKGWDYVQNLFRNSDFGRQTRIYITGANRSYAVSSVNTSNHTVQLVGESGSFTVLTDEQFRFVPTVSPFIVAGLDNSIYVYNTLEVRLSNSDSVPSAPWYTVGDIVISGGAITEVNMYNCETEDNKYGYLDTVSENQINTRHLIDHCVTNDKLAEDSIDGSKLANNSVSGTKLVDNSIPTNKLEDNAVTLQKVAKYGVLPTDIFRVDLHVTNFDLDSSGLGCLIVQGENNNYFVYDATHPWNPYRLRLEYDSTFPKILAFYPINRMVPGTLGMYSIAAPFVHFDEDGITCQVILFLSNETYNTLYTNGYRVLKGTVGANVYDDQKEVINYNIALNGANYLNLSFSQADLLVGEHQHIILDIQMTAAAS